MKSLTVKELTNLGYPDNVKAEMLQVGGNYEDATFYDPNLEINDSEIIASFEYLRDIFHDYKDFLEERSPIYLTETELRIFINRYQYPKSIAQLASIYGISQQRIRDAISRVRYAIWVVHDDVCKVFPDYESDPSSIGKYIKGDISSYTFIRNPKVPAIIKRAVITLIRSNLLGNITNLSHPQALRHIRPETLIRVDLIQWTDLAILEWVFRGELNKTWIDADQLSTPWSLKVQTKIWMSSGPPIIST